MTMNTTPQQPLIKTYRELLDEFEMEQWKAVDWNKTNVQIAYEMGASYPLVIKWRKIITGKSSQQVRRLSRKHHIDWDTVDWSEGNSCLARQLGINCTEVYRARMLLNKPAPTKNFIKRKISQEQLDAIDWEMTKDIDIANQLGVSRERIRQLRDTLNKPDCKVHRLRSASIVAYKWLTDHREELEGKTKREISELFNASHEGWANRTEFYRFLDRMGIKTDPKPSRKAKHDVDKFNFKLPNIVLSMVYGIPTYMIANERNRWYKDRPIWRLGGYSRLIHDKEFLAELEAEKKKAVELGYKPDSEKIAAWLKIKQEYRHPDARGI